MSGDAGSAVVGDLSRLGFGVFTTFRSFPNASGSQRFFRLDRHIERVVNSAGILGVSAIDPLLLRDECRRKIEEQVRGSFPDAALRVRLVITADRIAAQAETLVHNLPLERPVRLQSVSIERALPEHKSLSAAPSIVARRRALAAGADEALLIDRDELVREGAWSNFFWWDHRGVLHTPARAVLPGITRAAIIEIAETRLSDSALSEVLSTARAAALSLSTGGVLAVGSLDGVELDPSYPPLVSLIESYQKLLERELEEGR